ncbi:hypothetical protein [Thermocoleostomius sinensis]|uniref:Uncharacterized protein n=1 Tax=Thermocoleostomius sinensis A174 TaxID=2016057 RepID=A0A9E8ZC54_9CYAN|nr:hypothetical protein [Thermocoleostomius sinensis]WAL58688.1 hypothetical protein OXH18_16085 [Thermocoleostomius sinensis A174]
MFPITFTFWFQRVRHRTLLPPLFGSSVAIAFISIAADSVLPTFNGPGSNPAEVLVSASQALLISPP